MGACRTSSDIPLRKSAHLYIFEKKADRIDFSGHHRQRNIICRPFILHSVDFTSGLALFLGFTGVNLDFEAETLSAKKRIF